MNIIEKRKLTYSSYSASRTKPVYFCTSHQAATLLAEDRMLILFVRHGLTDWNMEMRLQGREDIPLNSIGRNQAHELALLFEAAVSAGLKLDGIYCSPLSRAYDTAEYISGYFSQESPVILSDLIERDYSTLSGLTLTKRKMIYPTPKDYPADMESVPATAQRIKKIAHSLCKSENSGSSVAVTHGGVINALFSYLTGGRAGIGKNISHNCCVAAVAAGHRDIIPLAFNLYDNAFIDYIHELHSS